MNKNITIIEKPSTFVKTAMPVVEADWGRIIDASGYSGINFDPGTLSLAIQDKILYKDGTKILADENELTSFTGKRNNNHN